LPMRGTARGLVDAAHSFTVSQDELLSDTGEFAIDFTRTGDLFSYAFHVAGTVGFRSATGSVEFKYPSLNEAEKLQLCTTGVLDRSTEWTGSEPAGARSGGTLPEGMTRLRIGRHGELVEVTGTTHYNVTVDELQRI
jgi:hypothetical protein